MVSTHLWASVQFSTVFFPQRLGRLETVLTSDKDNKTSGLMIIGNILFTDLGFLW